MDKITETPSYISERLMTLRMPLVKGEYATILSCYAPTLDSDDDQKDIFYEQLQRALSEIRKEDKIILLGDFNARVGTDSEIWGGVIGRNGIGKMNSNGLRLLTLCSEYNLTITNTVFRMKNRYKTSWQHPRSKHWHLLDYVIVRSSDLKYVKKTYAIRQAECSTDHRLMVSIIAWKLRPRPRRSGTTKRKLNCEALQNSAKRSQFQAALEDAFSNAAAGPPQTLTSSWERFSAGWANNNHMVKTKWL